MTFPVPTITETQAGTIGTKIPPPGTAGGPVIDMGGSEAVALGDIFSGEDLYQFRDHQLLGQDC